MSKTPRVAPIWLDARDAIAVHDRQLAEHGGAIGIRDPGLLDSALARPVNRWNYGADSAADLAAAYAYGVARNHPFIDGNKRTAWVLARVFLAINGHKLAFTAEDAIRMMLALAAGELDEAAMVEWFKARLRSA
jgi:death-on-curing protein